MQLPTRRANDSHLDILRPTCTVDSDGDSISSLRDTTHTDPIAGKTDVDSHFRLDSSLSSTTAASAGPPPPTTAAESPPPFASHNFPSRYFPEPSSTDPYCALVTAGTSSASLTALAPCGPAPSFEESQAAQSSRPSSVLAETKAALPRDTKDRSKDLDDGEPPPPYTEGSSPLEGFTYVMAAAGGATSIITQVQQGGPAPINTALAGAYSLLVTWLCTC